jgi:enamine deaminase RidA (YjgF/YER057c/UK114 family)
MANVEKLKGAGIFDPPGYHHLMKVTGIQGLLFTAGQVPFDIRYRPQFRTARNEFFGTKGPASTMVEVNHLSEPGYMIEIEAIAAI